MSSLKTPNELTAMILFGYINDIQTLFPYQINPYYTIPSDITLVTLSYLQNYFDNSGCYIWKIEDNKLLNKMFNARNTQKFESIPFEMARLKWKLEVYPNGFNIDTKGYVVIHLRLLSLPSMIEQIQVCRTFRVIENMSGSTWIAELRVNEYEFWSKKCSLQELIEISSTSMTICVEVIINRIQLKKHNNFDKMNLIKCKLFEYPKKQRFEHKLEGYELHIFKTSKHFKEMSSGIENKWSLSWNPNGMEDRSKNYVGVFLNVCTFPLHAKGVHVDFKVGCIETGKSSSYTWNFTVDACGFGDSYLMRLKDCMQYDCLTFYAQYELLDVLKQYKKLEICDEIIIAQLLAIDQPDDSKR
eukprot:200477_1